MKGLVDGLSLYINNNQASNYSTSIYSNLIKYSSFDFSIIKDYEIKSDMYKDKSIELLLNRTIDDFSNLKRFLYGSDYSFFHCLNNGFSFPLDLDFNYIMTVSSLLPLFFEQMCSSAYTQNFFKKFPYSVLKSNHIVCPSVTCKKDFLNNFSIESNKISVNYGALSDFYTPTDNFMSSIYIKSKFGLDSEFIIFYGDFNKRKELDKCILLFKNLKKEINNLVFLICSDNFSDNIYLEYLKNLIKKLGLGNSIFFLSNLTMLDKVNLFNNAMCFLDLSIYETVNLNIIHAYCCNTPLVCSSIDLYKEYLGDNCFYYEEGIDYLCIINYIKNYSLHNDDYVTKKFSKGNCLSTCLNAYNNFS